MIEYEVKVLDIDPKAFTKKANSLGFVLEKELSFRRVLFDRVPADDKALIRLRTDGSQATLTFKKFHENAIDGVEEHEVDVSDFETCKTLLQRTGLKETSYQENTRKLFLNPQRPDLEITIDQWPAIPPYAEVEGKSVEGVKKLLAELGVDESKVTSTTPGGVYKTYGIDISGLPVISFDNLPNSYT